MTMMKTMLQLVRVSLGREEGVEEWVACFTVRHKPDVSTPDCRALSMLPPGPRWAAPRRTSRRGAV